MRIAVPLFPQLRGKAGWNSRRLGAFLHRGRWFTFLGRFAIFFAFFAISDSRDFRKITSLDRVRVVESAVESDGSAGSAATSAGACLTTTAGVGSIATAGIGSTGVSITGASPTGSGSDACGSSSAGSTAAIASSNFFVQFRYRFRGFFLSQQTGSASNGASKAASKATPATAALVRGAANPRGSIPEYLANDSPGRMIGTRSSTSSLLSPRFPDGADSVLAAGAENSRGEAYFESGNLPPRPRRRRPRPPRSGRPSWPCLRCSMAGAAGVAATDSTRSSTPGAIPESIPPSTSGSIIAAADSVKSNGAARTASAAEIGRDWPSLC